MWFSEKKYHSVHWLGVRLRLEGLWGHWCLTPPAPVNLHGSHAQFSSWGLSLPTGRLWESLRVALLSSKHSADGLWLWFDLGFLNFIVVQKLRTFGRSCFTVWIWILCLCPDLRGSLGLRYWGWSSSAAVAVGWAGTAVVQVIRCTLCLVCPADDGCDWNTAPCKLRSIVLSVDSCPLPWSDGAGSSTQCHLRPHCLES